MASGDEGHIEDDLAKRRRLTCETLLHLSVQIKTAAEKGLWYGGTIWSEETVNKLVEDMIQTLEQQVLILEGAVALKVIEKSSRFLQDLFMEHPMYGVLHRFRGVFPKLDELIAATGASPSAATGASPAAATGASPAAATGASPVAQQAPHLRQHQTPRQQPLGHGYVVSIMSAGGWPI